MANIQTANQAQELNLASDFFEKFFYRLQANCTGLLFVTEKQLDFIKSEWILSLKENGINKTGLIENGFKKLRSAERAKNFIPSPAEFCAWCKEGYNPYHLPTAEELDKRVRQFFAYGFEEVDKFVFENDLERYLILAVYGKGKEANELEFKKIVKAELKAVEGKLNQGWQPPLPHIAIPEKIVKQKTQAEWVNRFSDLRKTMNKNKSVMVN